MINLTREKLAVNNIFKEKRSPPKNNRPPAQRACTRETADRPALSKAARVTCPEEMTDCEAQETGSREKPTGNKKRDWRQLRQLRQLQRMLNIQALCKETPNSRTGLQLVLAKRNAKAGETCAHMALHKARREFPSHKSARAREGYRVGRMRQSC